MSRKYNKKQEENKLPELPQDLQDIITSYRSCLNILGESKVQDLYKTFFNTEIYPLVIKPYLATVDKLRWGLYDQIIGKFFNEIEIKFEELIKQDQISSERKNEPYIKDEIEDFAMEAIEQTVEIINILDHFLPYFVSKKDLKLFDQGNNMEIIDQVGQVQTEIIDSFHIFLINLLTECYPFKAAVYNQVPKEEKKKYKEEQEEKKQEQERIFEQEDLELKDEINPFLSSIKKKLKQNEPITNAEYVNLTSFLQRAKSKEFKQELKELILETE